MGRPPLCLAALFLVSCTLAKVDVTVVGERTALENQVLGTYNSLDDEMLLAASVRAVDSEGRLKREPLKSPEQRDTVQAMQTLAFHEDDVATFKRLGWVGEDNQGLLTAFALERGGAPDDLREFAATYKDEEFRAVVAAVKQARDVVMRRVIELNETFTKGDLPRVRQVFARLNVQNALPGERVQGADGAWGVKR
ncbi:MAG: DUF1318 domain-containing protein [Deltaproteobacteria bacterium]|nr:DUF1318 domain-containing protein [Deltaproteobacteria bacterium]